MIKTLAIGNYRSLQNLRIPLDRLNLITGANASGKSNLYRALRLLAETAQGGVVNALAKEGGLKSTFWAGPETISRRMRSGEVPVQGSPKQKRTRLRLGFAGETFSYSISLGLPKPSSSAFALDPEIKKEAIWAGDRYHPARMLVDREGPVISVRNEKEWEVVSTHANAFDSLFSQFADPIKAPEAAALRDEIKSWRFYDHFRADAEAPSRLPQLGTRTLVLNNDGSDLAAALQTIVEIGESEALEATISDAFPGAELQIAIQEDGRFAMRFHQRGLLRALSGSELSDGTLRYLLWVAALLTPRPPPLMVLNEPETSLHPELLPALARLIIRAAASTQIWVVSHSSKLIEALESDGSCNAIRLEKELGQTRIAGQALLDQPAWQWPDKSK